MHAEPRHSGCSQVPTDVSQQHLPRHNVGSQLLTDVSQQYLRNITSGFSASRTHPALNGGRRCGLTRGAGSGHAGSE
jgi:hypothetical protein